MQPAGLQTSSFAAYPPRAREIATQKLGLLQQLPLPLLPILLRELGSYDWKFPREQRQIDAQLRWLGAMSAADLSATTQGFSALVLPGALSSVDWVNDAPGYMEQLTATLWSTHQMPAFRGAAQLYAERLADFQQAGPRPEMDDALQSFAAQEGKSPQAATPPARAGQSGGGAAGGTSSSTRHMGVQSQPVPIEGTAALPRLVMVVLAESLGPAAAAGGLFQKLRREGVLLDRVDPSAGYAVLYSHLLDRHGQAPEAYAHWLIDGGSPQWMESRKHIVTTVDYDALAPTRERLLARARDAMSADRSGPEELRTLMARLTPQAVGLGGDPVMSHFELSLLTEGSGTQIFSTTFVQWAARECLRRAQPSTLLCRYTPRQREQGMNELLSGAPSTGLDPAGSLVDAEQAAFYTWLNLQRLPNPQPARFLAWQEGSSTVVVLGPGLPRGTTSSSPMSVTQVLKLLA